MGILLDWNHCFRAEAGFAIAKHEVCDNVDLSSIVQEYESYCTIKFGRPPKLTKKISQDDRLSTVTSCTPADDDCVFP